MLRNPTSAQQPPPAYQNDATGFWGAVLTQSQREGIGSLLPVGTLAQSDTAIKARLLNAQISWTPTQARWKNCHLQVSIADGQFALALEAGGDVQNGQVTILVGKSQFNTGLPESGDTFKILAGGKWVEFVVRDMMGHHDDNEPGLTLFLDKDQDDLGE